MAVTMGVRFKNGYSDEEAERHSFFLQVYIYISNICIRLSGWVAILFCFFFLKNEL